MSSQKRDFASRVCPKTELLKLYLQLGPFSEEHQIDKLEHQIGELNIDSYDVGNQGRVARAAGGWAGGRGRPWQRAGQKRVGPFSKKLSE